MEMGDGWERSRSEGEVELAADGTAAKTRAARIRKATAALAARRQLAQATVAARQTVKGTMIVITPKQAINIVEMTEPPEVEVLRHFVGGDLEVIPHFTSIRYPLRGGHRVKCVAFGNEHSKLDPVQPRNPLADLLWCAALQSDHEMLTCHPDYLAGTIVILFGDDDFMRAL
jgi:hypothetical protein